MMRHIKQFVQEHPGWSIVIMYYLTSLAVFLMVSIEDWYGNYRPKLEFYQFATAAIWPVFLSLRMFGYAPYIISFFLSALIIVSWVIFISFILRAHAARRHLNRSAEHEQAHPPITKVSRKIRWLTACLLSALVTFVIDPLTLQYFGRFENRESISNGQIAVYVIVGAVLAIIFYASLVRLQRLTQVTISVLSVITLALMVVLYANVDDIQEYACIQKKGEWSAGCSYGVSCQMFVAGECQFPTMDSGKVCRSGSDCVGDCVVWKRDHLKTYNTNSVDIDYESYTSAKSGVCSEYIRADLGGDVENGYLLP